MEKNAIKKFAVWAREELIKRCSTKAEEYGISKDNIAEASAVSLNGRLLSEAERKQRRALIAKIEKDGYEQVIEEVAYTWFNRFIALRFMEVNNYLPTHIRVFTDENKAFDPQILKEALHVELKGLDREKVISLMQENKTDELYKYLLITQCNDLSSILPGMFQRIDDYTELLFPDNVRREGSIIDRMVRQGQSDSIPEEDWTDQVQIIGWLYQYYNSVPKDKVFANLKKNIKIKKEDIPAATQLFTPDWIVRYMVENSLGRLWLEGHPDDALRGGWKYYLDEAEQEEDVKRQLEEMRKEYASLAPEDICLIDPCMGSGHIIVYAFDVLMDIYRTQGWSDRDAVRSIVERNLFGLDIDERAAQLAYFAVMMKACQYDKRFLTRRNEAGKADIPQPNVYAIAESNGLDANGIDAFVSGDARLKENLDIIIEELHDAREYGSILKVTAVDFDLLYARLEEMKEEINIFAQTAAEELKGLLDTARLLAQQYDVVVTNPPYMGASNMNGRLNQFIKENYADYKSDFFSAFISHVTEMTKGRGYCGFFTPYVWMFIQSYEKLRGSLCRQKTIETLIQFEYSAFEEATVPVCTFVFQNRYISKKGCYFRLTEFRGGMEVQRQKTLEAIADHNCGYYYEANADNFSKIPGSPVAYWVGENFINNFEKDSLYNYSSSPSQNVTGNNDKYIRKHWELSSNKIGKVDSWIFYAKGGGYRKWWGNLWDVVNWTPEARHIYQYGDGKHASQIINKEYWYVKGITWGLISSALPSFRIMPFGATYDKGGSTIIVDKNVYSFTFGLLNSKVYIEIVRALNPTLNFQVKDVRTVPLVIRDKAEIDPIVEQCIEISKTDWDAYETSWDFKRHPLV